jgi:hypothetical protein
LGKRLEVAAPKENFSNRPTTSLYTNQLVNRPKSTLDWVIKPEDNNDLNRRDHDMAKLHKGQIQEAYIPEPLEDQTFEEYFQLVKINKNHQK